MNHKVNNNKNRNISGCEGMFRNRIQPNLNHNKEKMIDGKIESNINIIKEVFNFPINKDFILLQKFLEKKRVRLMLIT